jgi:putative N6-adenine-specific DNA methylase
MPGFPLIAKTSFGFEELLMAELNSLGATSLKKATRAVFFEGDDAVMYKANLYSRVALRILKPIKQFRAGNEQELYDEIKKIDWTQFLSADDTLAVDSVVSRSEMDHSLYISLKTKDAIVDQFRDKFGKRPNVDLDFPKVRINVHMSENQCSVSLDSSGSSLHKRGYREQQGEAPLNETLAAGMIMMSRWKGNGPLTDIMCGSGTIPIEAALIARNIAPGSFRNEFGFERWDDFDSELWSSIVDEAKSGQKESLPFRITGVDRNKMIIRDARQNAVNAGVSDDIDFEAMRFEDYYPEVSEQTVITNPPYGGRITDDDLFELYKSIGDTFKKKFSGSTAWVLTANRDASKKIGLHPSRKIPLYNGALECRYMKYELYSGSKKAAKQPAQNSGI